MHEHKALKFSSTAWHGVIAAMVLILSSMYLVCAPTGVLAQGDEPELRLRLRRDFGYGAGTQIQGRFSLIVDDADDLQRVSFYVDDQLIGEDSEAPFRLRFSTDGYELGWHTLRAVGETSGGRTLSSNVLQRQFVTGSTGGYLFAAVVGLVVLFRVVSHFVTRERGPGAKKGYGIYGGAVCPRCGRPFSRHWWAPNLIAGKFDRCPHCGKWHFSTRATPQMLASAEAFAEELDAEEALAVTAPDEEEVLRKRLDESRFDD